ncbi:MAG TPA: MscL family protein [Solirubrobacterales bacterium]|nr:MscL family protein [Solirubrobacterales bacterium]
MIGDVFRDLRALLLKGDLFALAAALLLALAAFSFLQALVEGLISPLIAAVFDKASIYLLGFTINGSEFSYGTVLAALIVVICAGVLIFFAGAALRRDDDGTDVAGR